MIFCIQTSCDIKISSNEIEWQIQHVVALRSHHYTAILHSANREWKYIAFTARSFDKLLLPPHIWMQKISINVL